MRLIKEGENLKGQTVFIIGNNNSHNYPVGFTIEIKNDAISKPNGSNFYFTGLTDGGNTIYMYDLVIVDDEDIKILKKRIINPQKVGLYKISNSIYSYKQPSEANTWIFAFYRKGNAPLYFQCLVNVTDNCQICSFKSFNGTIVNLLTKDEYNQLFIGIKTIIGKALMIIDVNHAYETNIDKLFKVPVLKQKYNSSNGSNMILYLVNINQYLNENSLATNQYGTEYFDNMTHLLNKLNSHRI